MRYLRLADCLACCCWRRRPPLPSRQPSPDEFVPISEVPPEEQIPAITLLAAAYGFVWVAVLGYVWSLGRRLQPAEREIAAARAARIVERWRSARRPPGTSSSSRPSCCSAIVIGWILGSRAAHDAMAMELRKREEARRQAEAAASCRR